MEILGFAAGPYKTNCYVLVNDGAVAVIDPGMHSHDQLVEFLAERGCRLDKIVLTHGHIDHTRDAGTLAARYNVSVYLHPDDAFMLDGGRGVSERTAMLFDAANMTPIRDLRELVDGAVIELAGEEFLLVHAPGHSPGCTLLVGEEYCFTGDVLFKGSIGRTDLGESDPEAMDRSLRTAVLPLADSLVILPGHGPTTTMRAERMSNPFLRGLND